MKLPWLKLWTAQTLADTISLSLEAKGAWFAILCDLAESPTRGMRAKTPAAWARLLGVDKKNADRVLDELRRSHAFAFNETESGEWEIVYDAMVRETQERENANIRQRRHVAKRTPADAKLTDFSRKNDAAEDRSQRIEETPPSRPPLGEATDEAGDTGGETPPCEPTAHTHAEGDTTAAGGADGAEPSGTGAPPESPALAELARLFSPQAHGPRPRRERRAWAQITPPPPPEEVALVRAFYALPKSRACDETWRRKNALVRLLHEWQEQREAAAAFFAREPWRLARPKTSAEAGAPPEPPDWRATAARLYPHADLSVSWLHLWRHHPEVCRELAQTGARLGSSEDGEGPLYSPPIFPENGRSLDEKPHNAAYGVGQKAEQ